MTRATAPWIAFLLACFAVVGLMGLFASYAAPLPYQRAAARDVVLDRALQSGGDKAALEALRVTLDDSAAVVIDGAGPLDRRVTEARSAAHAEMEREAEAIGFRLRLELVVVTLAAGAFGAVMLAAAARASP